jgi:hypothetical protein
MFKMRDGANKTGGGGVRLNNGEERIDHRLAMTMPILLDSLFDQGNAPTLEYIYIEGGREREGGRKREG